MSYIYWRSEPGLYTVGYIAPGGMGVNRDRHPESDWATEGEAAQRVIELNGGPAQSQARLAAAARAALPALELLGDYIGNEWPGSVSYPPFDRCKILLELKRALQAADPREQS